MPFDLNVPVLVVDDYREMARLVRTQLTDLGFRQVLTAEDGATALALVRSRSIGLVISDYNMKPMNGLQLLREIRLDKLLVWLPFIMISGSGDEQAIVEAKRAGVTDYLLKPFTRATLKAKLEIVLGAA
jgi:two-component system, chemotaxis family, chemotaxis protein CheY